MRQKNPKAIFSPSLDKFLDYDSVEQEFVIRDLTGSDERNTKLMSLPKGLITFSKRSTLTEDEFVEQFKRRFMFVADNRVRIISFEDSMDAVWEINEKNEKNQQLVLISAYCPLKRCLPSKIEEGFLPDRHFFYDLETLEASQTLFKLVKKIDRIKANVHHEMTIAKKLGANLSTQDLYS